MKKYVSKALILMMSVLLFVQQFSISAVAATPEVPNLELNFKALQQEVLSGKTANFELDVKVTGSQTTLTNGKIIVNLPQHAEFSMAYPQIKNGVPDKNLTIAGVSPIYDAEKSTLTYTFPELKSGQVYKTTIQAVSELEKTPVSDKDKNIRELEADVSIIVDQYKDALNSGKKTTKVISNEAKAKEEKEAQEAKAKQETATQEFTTTQETAIQRSTATPRNANLELYLNPLQQEVLSGKTANFELDVKVTGSQTTLTNGKIVVNLPKHAEVPVVYPQIQNGVPDKTLTIAGVSPVYDAKKGTLTYTFPELKSGQVYKTIIQATPELGKTPVSDKDKNIRNLEADASMKVDQYAEVLNSGKKTTMVISNGAVSISKAYTSTKKYKNNTWNVSDDAPVQGDLAGWTIKVSIPKKAAGISYIQENSKIRIVDQLPTGLTFAPNLQEPGFTGVYNATNRTVTWEFDAPTFAQQEQVSMNRNLFEKELKLNLKFDSSIPNFSTVKNTANATYQPYSTGSTSPTSATGSGEIMIASGGGDTSQTTGNYYYDFHNGPVNGSGNFQTDKSNLDYIPTVTDDAYLQFRNGIYIGSTQMDYSINSGPWQSESYTDKFYQQIINSGYKHFTMEYTIDSKLDLTQIKLGKPYEEYISTSAPVPLTKVPDTFIQLKINGVWKSEYPVQYPISNQFDTQTDKLDVTQFGKDGHVEAFRVIYRNASGKMNAKVFSFYNVEKGAVGLATNSVTYKYELNDGTKVVRKATDDQSVQADRHVNIVKTSSTAPIVKTAIQFVEGGDQPLSGSTIQRGNNRIQIEFQNDAASQANIQGPLELVALLPKGVNILNQPNMLYSTNSVNPKYQVIGEVNGQQQIKFTWDNQRVLPDGKVTASFDVDVTSKSLSDLNMLVYGFSANQKLQVPSSQGDTITKSVLETDTSDLNKNGNITEPRVKSANKYSLVKNDNLQIEKLVKGSLDNEFSLFGHTNPDGDVTYRFNLTNTTSEIIEQFMFLDVLPSVGDLGITDNKARDSKFETTLKGPISFTDTKWQDKVTVYYSKSKNPKRDDLYATVDYSIGSTPQPNPTGAENPNWMPSSMVTNWNEIHSFKIVMKEGVDWLEGQNVQFDIQAKASSLPVDLALLDEKIPEINRAAWNSFAVTTNGLLAVEPLRVGVVMKGIPGSIELTKIDAQTGNVLSGATFELRKYESDNSTEYSVIASGTTDGLGKLLLKDIPLGSYKLIETKAPNDYMLLTAPIDVTITSSGEVVKLTVKNSKNGWVIPETGGSGTTLFYGMGVFIMIIALFLFLRKRNRNN
ncbi:SpaA isopeptide-forming pilin-related protein [Bacillus wiedmannii]|uniref:SpaA isopeptide-forming pilin-related protein n=1 Tax=Bacillus wiedmannii TaxID=1890302 RepID=UPI0024ACF422|nr:SpaA isopeptide-forming pilin-related protein [Bacillus wiedmannii]MDI6679993.1 SpaA isopeptide-forming pilin-related protein [Bacillus wiedmannii]